MSQVWKGEEEIMDCDVVGCGLVFYDSRDGLARMTLHKIIDHGSDVNEKIVEKEY